MKSVAKILVVVVVVLIGVASLSAAIMRAMPTRLDPGAARLLAQANAYRPGDAPGNAYYALLGLQLPGNRDPAAKGRAYAGRLAAMDHRRRPTYFAEPVTGLFKLPRAAECEWGDRDCLVYCRRHEARIEAAIRPYRHHVADYARVIKRYHDFYEVRDNSSWPLHTQALYLFEVVRHWNAGDREVALRDLHADEVFWRMILRKADTRGSRGAAIIAVRRDFGLVGDLVVDHAKCVETKVVSAMLAPLTKKEMDLTPVFQREFVRSVRIMEGDTRHSGNDISLTAPKRSLRNKAINTLYSIMRDKIRIARADDGARRRLAARIQSKYKLSTGLLGKVQMYVHPIATGVIAIAWYNPIGFIDMFHEYAHDSAGIAKKTTALLRASCRPMVRHGDHATSAAKDSHRM